MRPVGEADGSRPFACAAPPWDGCDTGPAPEGDDDDCRSLTGCEGAWFAFAAIAARPPATARTCAPAELAASSTACTASLTLRAAPEIAPASISVSILHRRLAIKVRRRPRRGRRDMREARRATPSWRARLA